MDSEHLPVHVETESHAMVTHDSMENYVHEMELSTDAVKRVLPTFLKVCNSKGIIDFGGKPFVSDAECQKIARCSGISYDKPDIIAEWIDDPETNERVYEVLVEGCARWMGQEIFSSGGCNSKDKFFKNRSQSFTALKLEVRKKAVANWRGSCVRHLFGLNSLSWEDLNQLGFNQGNAGAGVDFKQGRHSSKDDGAEDAAAAKDTKKKIGQQIMMDCGNDKDKAGDVLEQLTAFTAKDGKEVAGKRSALKLSDKQANFLWSKIKPNGKEREKYENIIQAVMGDAAGPEDPDCPL